MQITNGLFTSECVAPGHPDKLCDRISDAFVDAFLSLDPRARVACEALAADNKIVVAGEFRAKPGVFDAVLRDAEQVVRTAVHAVGFGTAEHDIDPETCRVEILFNEQSPEISAGVDGGSEQGAGDQGIMFGFACDETPELMPLSWSLANALLVRGLKMNHGSRFQRGASPVRPLRADAKSQVTIRYRDGRPEGVAAVVLSWQHSPEVDLHTIRDWLSHHVIDAVIPAELRTPDFVAHINPAGSFTRGGPKGDTGLTGRKIVVDTYGGAAPHGGGAFSGKDPSKVDRSAAYAARWVAKNIVAAGLARRATVQLSYAIGVAAPVSISVDTAGTGIVSDDLLASAVQETFDLRPAAITSALDLARPIYAATSSLGHFGAARDPEIHHWERTDRVAQLRTAANKLGQPQLSTETRWVADQIKATARRSKP